MQASLVFLRQKAILIGVLVLYFVTTTHAQPQSMNQERAFTIATWGGNYADAQMRALFQPFANSKELVFDVIDFSGSPEEIAYQRQIEQVFWDVVDMEMDDVNFLCERDALQKIDFARMRVDSNDFIAGALSTCGIGNAVWSLGVVYDPNWFDTETQPSTFANFFNPEFRGARALAPSPIGLMELALLASGNHPDELYTTLSSDEGVSLALDKLSEIKQQIQWYDDEISAMNAVINASASMSFVPHILPARQAVNSGISLTFLWDKHLYQMDAFTIMRDTPYVQEASDFLIASSLPDYQGTMATLSLYGVTNYKALNFLSQTILSWMPHAEANRDGALKLNKQWWNTPKGQAAVQAFEAWREK